jgi:hypothetical protein
MDKKMALLQMINAEKKLIFENSRRGLRRLIKLPDGIEFWRRVMLLSLPQATEREEDVRDSLWAT